MGIVQTAYANGASTAFIRDTLGIQVAVTPTGVKYLHEEAVKFDIGIYFEANGHGTVLFSPSLLQRLQQVVPGLCIVAKSRFSNCRGTSGPSIVLCTSVDSWTTSHLVLGKIRV